MFDRACVWADRQHRCGGGDRRKPNSNARRHCTRSRRRTRTRAHRLCRRTANSGSASPDWGRRPGCWPRPRRSLLSSPSTCRTQTSRSTATTRSLNHCYCHNPQPQPQPPTTAANLSTTPSRRSQQPRRPASFCLSSFCFRPNYSAVPVTVAPQNSAGEAERTHSAAWTAQADCRERQRLGLLPASPCAAPNCTAVRAPMGILDSGVEWGCRAV